MEKEGIREVNCEHHSPAFLALKWPKCDCLYRIDDLDNAGFCKRPEYYRCIKEAGVMSVPLSYSSVSDFLTCPMLYYLKAIRGIVMKPSAMGSAVKMGALWDRAKQNLLGKSVNMGEVVEEYEIKDMDIAKVKAVNRAYKELGIKVDQPCVLQAEFNNEIVADGLYAEHKIPVKVKGFYDRKYKNYFAEDKLSGRPDNYLDIFFIQSQIGAYFLADPSLEYCIMEIVRTPDLKSTGRFKEESAGEHEDRTFSDILSRPSFYFIGYDREKKCYGKKFFRNEFDLAGIRDRFRIVSIMIKDCAAFDGWYKNDRACGAILPGIPCDMKGVCRYNTMSETMYAFKKKTNLFGKES
uniref:PD-(D/E)XK nuclease superfamily protein n=1 Tax=viral metagenome TaxID=1070528 RepID=A0A6H1ZH90_9ZZZZ